MDTPVVHHGAMFDTNELVINMGPQHPSTHGVLRVVLRLDGEKVVDADVVIGYLHRGIEKLSENRNWMRIGGLALDLPPGWDRKVLEFCSVMDSKVDEYEELLTHNRIWLERTKGIGVISGKDAVALGLSGPPLRGSGVPKDVRKDEPYAAYDEMQFDVPIGTAGDTYDRYLVRLEEFRQSLRIIR